MDEDEEYDCKSEGAIRKGIGDGVGPRKVWNGPTCSHTRMSENENVNMYMEKNLPVDNSRGPVDCPRNSTDEGGIRNDGKHAEEREVAISDEVGFIKHRVLEQVEELSARLASFEAQMKAASFLYKLDSTDHLQHETPVSPPLHPSQQCPDFLSPPLMTVCENSSDNEESGSGKIQRSPLLFQLEGYETSSCCSMAHDETHVAHSGGSRRALLCTHGLLESTPSSKVGEEEQQRKNLGLLDYVQVEALEADSHGCGDPQVWIC